MMTSLAERGMARGTSRASLLKLGSEDRTLSEKQPGPWTARSLLPLAGPALLLLLFSGVSWVLLLGGTTTSRTSLAGGGLSLAQVARKLHALPASPDKHQHPGCLLAGPVSVPDNRTLFSATASEAGEASLDPSLAQCLYSLDGVALRTTPPGEIQRNSDGKSFIYCPPRLDSKEDVEVAGLPCPLVPGSRAEWNNVVYEALAQPEGVYVWVKGEEFSTAPETRFCALSCTFFQPGSMSEALHVDPVSCGQELVFCPSPWAPGGGVLPAAPLWVLSLEINGHMRPSVAVMDMPRQLQLAGGGTTAHTRSSTSGLKVPSQAGPSYFACACAMVYNVQRFLQEWLPYNSKLGIEKFFIYDNGSEDKAQAVLDDFEAKGIEMTRLFWPWPKTHQSALSHCALLARPQCKWIMMMDVDEFLLPDKTVAAKPLPGGGVSLVRRFLETVVGNTEKSYSKTSWCKAVGQVAIQPLVFGPSGNKSPPRDGTVLGYTCRVNATEKRLEKLFVLGEALVPPLMNLIHYWVDMQEHYCYLKLETEEAVFNHYKYPAWDDYKMKLQRRAPTYTPDLMTTKNMSAMAEIRGLVVELDRPADWETRFCEVEDRRMANLVRKLFPNEEENKPWYKW